MEIKEGLEGAGEMGSGLRQEEEQDEEFYQDSQ